MSDLISRQDIIYHKQFEPMGNGQYECVEVAYKDDIEALPSAEPSIVRCRECKHWNEWENRAGSCHRSENRYNWFGVDYDDYCSFGERKSDG